MTLTKIKPAGLSKPIDLADNEKIRLGTGTDLQIYHDGTNSFIKDTAGASLNIIANEGIAIKTNNTEFAIACNKNGAVELYHDNSGPKLATTSTGVNLGGGTCTFNDNGKITLGTGSDLQIYHDGSNSYIHDGGTGQLRVSSSNFKVLNAAQSATIINAVEDGAVSLYHAGTNRLETSNNGVAIYGFTDARQDSTGAYSTSGAPGNVLARFWNGSSQDNSHSAIQLRASNDNAAADMWWISCVAQSQNYNGFLAFSGRTTSSASQELVRFSNNGNVVVNAGHLQSTGGFLTVDAASYKISNSSIGSSSTTYYIGNQAIQTSSDRRIKENIVNTEVDALSELQKVRVVDFNWNDPSDTAVTNRNSRGKWTGCIAQEIVDVFPFAVNAPRTEDNKIDNNSEALWGMEYGQLVPVLIKAIQDLNTKVAALEGA